MEQHTEEQLSKLKVLDKNVRSAFCDHLLDETSALKQAVINLARQRDEYAAILRKQWHDITQISPPVNRFILVCAAFTNDYGDIRHRDHETLKAYCDQHGDWRTSNGRLYADITHWMELPELPQEIITL